MDEWMDGMGQVVGAGALEVGCGPIKGEVMRISSGHTGAQGALAAQPATLPTTDLPSGAARRASAEMPRSVTAAAAGALVQPDQEGPPCEEPHSFGCPHLAPAHRCALSQAQPSEQAGPPRGRRAALGAGPSVAGSCCASATWRLRREEKKRGWTWVPLTWTDTSEMSVTGLLDLFSFPSCTLKNGSEPEEPQDSAKTDTQ
nr:uncharacterized protein LOC129460230 [Symphalangus syndactylus]